MTGWTWRQAASIDRKTFESRFVDAYLGWITGLIRQHAYSLDWLVAAPVHRNQKTSGLLDACFLLALVKAGVEEELIDLPSVIRVASPELAAQLRGYFAQHHVGTTVESEDVPHSRVGPVWALLQAVAAAARMLIRHVAARVTGHAQSYPTPIILVELFTEEDTPAGPLERNYYPGLLEHVDDRERRAIVFLANPLGIRHYRRHFAALRRAGGVLIREDYLHASDYLHALGHAARLRRLAWSVSPFLGFDLTALVSQELRASAWDDASLTALLNERLMARVAERGVVIRRVVDWFENQVIDRGLARGVARYYPDVPSIGYAGYIAPANLLHVYPLEVERRAGILPQEVTVIGRAILARLRGHCPDLPAGVAPAFRYNHVRTAHRGPAMGDGRPSVLVALPYYRDDAVATLDAADGLQRVEASWSIRLKLHPRLDRARIERILRRPLSRHYQIVSGDMAALLRDADVFVTSTSTTAFEALAMGVPVAVVCDPARLSQSPIPDEIPPAVWAACFGPDELVGAVQRFLSNPGAVRDACENVRARILEDYFEPVTRGSVRRFLGLEGGQEDRPEGVR